MTSTVLPMAEADVVVWYNPRCSTCRGAQRFAQVLGRRMAVVAELP